MAVRRLQVIGIGSARVKIDLDRVRVAREHASLYALPMRGYPLGGLYLGHRSSRTGGAVGVPVSRKGARPNFTW